MVAQIKGGYFNKLDKKVSSLATEKGIGWVEKNQFGIQLDKRIRGKWSANWNKFFSNPTSPEIETKNLRFDEFRLKLHLSGD